MACTAGGSPDSCTFTRHLGNGGLKIVDGEARVDCNCGTVILAGLAKLSIRAHADDF